MRNKVLTLLALMLCMGALFLPVTAYAASGQDTTPPTIQAQITGDNLHVEASDADSGVEAVFINSARVNYRVDGAFDVPLADYAGSGEYISAYAVDFAGNQSDTVQLKNPRYTAPTATSTPTSTPTAASTPTESESSAPEATDESAADSPFTPDGTGTVMDNVTEQNGKEFFTITTDDNVFYLIIDRQRDSDNVYLLNAVTEDDLMALAEKSGGGSSASTISTPEPSSQTPEPTPEPEPEPEAEPESSGGSGPMILIVIAVIAVGGAGYYFKILKPKRDAELNGDDEDGYDEEDETDDLEFLDEPGGEYYDADDGGNIDYTADESDEE